MDKLKQKILVVEGRTTIGGGQMMTRQIIDSLKQDYCVELLCPVIVSDAFDTMFGDVPIWQFKQKNYNLGRKSFSDYFYFLYNFIVPLLQIYGIVRRGKYELVYVQHPRMIPVTAFICLFVKCPIIVHIHVVHTNKWVRRFVNSLIKLHSVKKVIGGSDYSLQQFKGIDHKKLVVYNCVRPLSFRHYSMLDVHSRIQCSVNADIFPAKNQHLLCKSILKLPNHSDYSVYFAGNVIDKSYLGGILNEFKELDLKVCGCIDDMDSFLENIDVVIVVSSGFETFSLSMVECWSKGVLCIASRVGGMKELVQRFAPHYSHCLLFTPHDSEDLARKIQSVMTLSCEEKNKIVEDLHQIYLKYFSKEVFKQKILQVVKDTI